MLEETNADVWHHCLSEQLSINYVQKASWAEWNNLIADSATDNLEAVGYTSC